MLRAGTPALNEEAAVLCLQPAQARQCELLDSKNTSAPSELHWRLLKSLSCRLGPLKASKAGAQDRWLQRTWLESRARKPKMATGGINI